MQSTGVWTHGVAALLLLATSACTKDFSRFQFHDLAGSRDGGRSGGIDSGMDAQLSNNQIDGAPDSAGFDSGPHDANAGEPGDANKHPDTSIVPQEEGGHSPNLDAGMPPIKVPEDAHVHEDARMPGMPQDSPDAQMPPDAQPAPDAQVVSDVQMCLDNYSAVDSNNASCRSCTCNECTDVTLDCLVRGDAYKRGACTQLWACAVANGCRDWDCYCKESDTKCRMTPSAPASGPCALEMEKAAMGNREMVSAVHMSMDPTNPLVRAIKAIACTIGTTPTSIGGDLTPKCKDSCSVATDTQ